MPLITRHNRLLLRRAIVHFVLSLVATVLTAAIFYGIAVYLIDSFDLDALRPWQAHLAAGALLLTFVSGWFTWRRGAGHRSYEESEFFLADSAGTVGGFYAHRVAAPIYLIGQLALAAPLQLFRGLQDLRLRVPRTAELETRLRGLLDIIVAKKTWHSNQAYRNLGTELACLVRLEAVDFSPRKGSVRVRDEFVD